MMCLAFLCFMTSRVMAEESVFDKYHIIDCDSGNLVASEVFVNDVLSHDVIYSLESHGRKLDHNLQKELTELLFDNNPKTVLIHEHFRKNAYDHQELLDLFRDGKITDDEFYRKISDISMEYPAMKSLLDLIRQKGIKSIAVNIPIPFRHEILPKDTVTVKGLRIKLLSGETLREGFDSLSELEKSFLPKDGFKILCDKEFHNFIFGEGTGHNGGDMEKIHTGFWVMNETMARSILDFFEDKNNTGFQILFGTGSNHGIFKGAIRTSVENRNGDLRQLTVLPLSSEDFSINDKDALKFFVDYHIADYVITPKN